MESLNKNSNVSAGAKKKSSIMMLMGKMDSKRESNTTATILKPVEEKVELELVVDNSQRGKMRRLSLPSPSKSSRIDKILKDSTLETEL